MVEVFKEISIVNQELLVPLTDNPVAEFVVIITGIVYPISPDKTWGILILLSLYV